MSWRGTALLGILAALALGLFLYSHITEAPSPDGPLLNLDPSLADKIRIEEGGSEFSLVKTNGLWNIEGSLNDRADPRLVHAILETAADITPLDLLKPNDLKGNVSLDSLNLKKPDRAITFRAGKKHRLWLGVDGPAPGEIYSRLDGGKIVYLIDNKIAEVAFHPVQEYRDPRLTALSSDHLEDVTFSKSDGLQQLHVQKNAHGWNLLSPITALGDTKAITTWLNTWLGARITSWLPEGGDLSSCGMDSPSAVVTLREEGETNPLTITIGGPVPDAPGSFYVHCSDRPGICTIADLAPSLAVTPQTLRSKQLPQIEYDTIDRIEIQNKGTTLSLTRKLQSDDWQVSQDGKTTVIPGSSVKAWFDQLQSLSALSYEPATPTLLSQRGFDPALQPFRIRFIAQLSENTAQENAGDAVLGDYSLGIPSGGEEALHAEEATDLMILPADALENLKAASAQWFNPAPANTAARKPQNP